MDAQRISLWIIFYNMKSSSYLLYMKRARYLRIITGAVIVFLLFSAVAESYLYFTMYKEWAATKVTTEQSVIYYLDD